MQNSFAPIEGVALGTRAIAIATALVGVLVVSLPNAKAVESGFGVYLLGSKGPGAGTLPAAGFYAVSQQYVYSGEYSGPFVPAPGVRSEADIGVDASFNMLSPVWITDHNIFGGRLGVSATIPVGNVDVSIDTLGTQTFDSRFSIGDPLVSVFSGWRSGNFHWNAGATFVAPIGQYDATRPANLALNRPAVDVFGALTWREPNMGLDISGAIGVTFNGKNSETQYSNGHEFHGEWAVSKALTSQLSVGVIGYHYEQLTPDGGPGAALGGFEGRVTALGGFVNYAFLIEDKAVSVRLQALDEFNVKNRFEASPIALNVVVSFGP